MRGIVAGLCALIAALIAATGAGASASAHIVLQLNDSFTVAGTDLACQAEVGKGVLPGQKIVVCFKLNGADLEPKSYLAALAAGGRVVAAWVDAKGNISKQVFDRKPARLSAQGRQLTAHVGDQLQVANTDLICVVNKDASGTYPTCFRATSRGAIPKSYAIAETEKFLGIVQFDAKGKITKLVFKRVHGTKP
jgi:hypothetical protein